MELTVKITRRVAVGVARRLKLAASVRSRSMSAMVNDALDQALPSLEEIRMQLAAPAGAAEAGWLGDLVRTAIPGRCTRRLAAAMSRACTGTADGAAMTAAGRDRAAVAAARGDRGGFRCRARAGRGQGSVAAREESL